MELNRATDQRDLTIRTGVPARGIAAASAAAFVLLYGQSPLFTQNQNAYLLAPAARAGYGHLANDWLANQAFPFYLFNAISELTFRSGQLWLFQGYHALLAVAYFASLVWLVLLLCPREQRRQPAWFALAAVILIHVPVGELVWRVTGIELREPLAFLTNGLADQHVFGREFQPSAFGVLALAALAFLQAQRPLPALFALTLAAYMHPSYVVMNSVILAGWALHVALQRQWRTAMAVVAVWTLLSVPVLIALVRLTGGADEQVARTGQEILARRIPMHTDPNVWLGAGSFLKLALMLAGGILSRGEVVGRILLLGFAVCVVSVLWMSWIFVPSVALAFPWRVSVVLVPAATAVLIARAWRWARTLRVSNGAAAGVLWLLVATAGAAGAYLQYARWNEHRGENWMGVAAHARATAAPDSVYLLPPSEGPHKRYWELQGFRLESGVPSYVDATSHPVAPAALLVWEERLRFAKDFYRRGRVECAAVSELARRGISHLVVARDAPVDCPAARRVHADDAYEIYAVR
jgi:hypothetical protein